MPLSLFPAVDIRDGNAVRLTQGRVDKETVHDADPVVVARAFAEQGAEWLHVVDLDAAFSGEPRNRHLIADIAHTTGVPVQASGGVRSLDDLDAAIGFGASRVVIGTMALDDPSFVRAALDAHGDKVAVGLDAEGTTLKARGWARGWARGRGEPVRGARGIHRHGCRPVRVHRYQPGRDVERSER